MRSALLLHGLGSGPSTLWRIRDWLGAAGWTVEAPPLLGHGGREAAAGYALDAYVDDVLPHGDFDLVVGHSLGGSVAIRAASRRPGWAKRLILIEPAIALDPQTIAVARPAELAELRWTRDEAREYLPRWDERDLDAKLAEAARALPDAVARTFTENAQWDLRADAERIGVSTLVVVGDRATNYSIVDEATWQRLVAANPRLEFITVPGTGHSPHRDDPAATRAIVLGWLNASAG